MRLDRRRFLAGLFIAPAIVQAAHLMSLSPQGTFIIRRSYVQDNDAYMLERHWVYAKGSKLCIQMTTRQIIEDKSKVWMPYLFPVAHELQDTGESLLLETVGNSNQGMDYSAPAMHLPTDEWIRQRELQVRRRGQTIQAALQNRYAKINGLYRTQET